MALLNSHSNRDWLILSESLGLSQLVSQPTRVSNTSSYLIDHIFSSDEDNLSQVHVCQTGISDHFAVFGNKIILTSQ